MYTIHNFHKKATCEYAGREGEAVEISSADGSIDHAILCFPELQKLLRFRQSQIEKKNGDSLKEKSVGSKNV
ncbi:hypothetical protein [Gimesia fumaroli]|uniref:Uncharacterized protein n=1 Tax=Gimesia fumaroli TaxID=2527976 RepID=A0A518I611_9PLAN|nr:hypothetical protein [Gimesia fumaroli]QDV48499.1 hypothetical protein Enr17x_05110 [Gimesia fumaroli]